MRAQIAHRDRQQDQEGNRPTQKVERRRRYIVADGAADYEIARPEQRGQDKRRICRVERESGGLDSSGSHCGFWRSMEARATDRTLPRGRIALISVGR